MKKLFFTGLITLLPFTLTLIIVLYIINLFTDPFQAPVEAMLEYYNLLDHPFLFFSGKDVLTFSSKTLALIALFAFIVLIGLLGHMVIAKTFLRFSEYVIARIPIVNKIYKIVQEAVLTLFNPKSASFSQAALVPFPYPGVYTMGFISLKQSSEKHNANVLVFIPGTPNPTAGFMLSFKHEEIIFLEMKIEDAVKFVISCGTANTEIR